MDAGPPPPLCTPAPCTSAAEPVPVGVRPTPIEADCADPPSAAGMQIEAQLAGRRMVSEQNRAELFDPTVMTVVTCGTGTPLPSDRAQACTGVFVNGKFFLFDAGDGAQRSIEALQLPIEAIEALFLTHFHSDHIADVGEVISRSWLLGRREVLPIYGGPGLERIVDGFNLIYSLDSTYRTEHHDGDFFPTDSAHASANVIEDPGAEGSLVYDAEGVTITAFALDHSPIVPAYGYRVEYAGRSIAITGDTVASPGLRALASGVDVLVSEVLSTPFIEEAECALERLGIDDRATIFRDIRTYHVDLISLGELAEEAGVGQLVLTHMLPSLDAPIASLVFGTPLQGIYTGELIIAEDGTRVSLALE